MEIVDKNLSAQIDRIIFHPGYDPSKYDASLALLKLKTPFTLNEKIKPAFLELDPPRKIYKGQLIGIGFGVTYTSVNSKGHIYSNNSHYLREFYLQDQSGKLKVCWGKNLDEFVCLSGTGASK